MSRRVNPELLLTSMSLYPAELKIFGDNGARLAALNFVASLPLA